MLVWDQLQNVMWVCKMSESGKEVGKVDGALWGGTLVHTEEPNDSNQTTTVDVTSHALCGSRHFPGGASTRYRPQQGVVHGPTYHTARNRG